MARHDSADRARRRVLILGAAGRDFHNFNLVYRDAPEYEVVAFTAAQIPGIDHRLYPPALAGSLYPAGIPILPEAQWTALVTAHGVDEVVFAYSDVPHLEVMHVASRALALGADFRLLGPRATVLRSTRPVVSVCAVRTGSGKSPVSRFIARLLRESGLRVAVVRHPMPYGALARQAVQRFATLEDLTAADTTIEEREEYEPHIAAGDLVFAGVDYERILRQAESEADVLIWDGGNNDYPFFDPDLDIVLADPHRPGHELSYFPGETNAARAGVIVLTKVNTADAAAVELVRRNIATLNPAATVIETAMSLQADDPAAIAGKRVLVIEDGPTLTHGGMSYGAGWLTARQFQAAEVVDPRPYAAGSIKQVFRDFPHLGPVLPAMGYSQEQIDDLAATVAATPCDAVLVASPVDLGRLLNVDKRFIRVRYEVEELGEPRLSSVVRAFIGRGMKNGPRA